VLDEKMKDSVKITVIATGFREVRAGVGRANQRHVETHQSFAASHDDAMGLSNMGLSNMDFPDPLGPAEAQRFPESYPDPTPREAMEEPRMAESSPGAMAHGADVISLDTMRSAMVANFEQDDLDVPAFLRKRGEVM